MATPSTSPWRALLIVPGMLCWALLLPGIFMKNNAMIGAGVVLFLITAIGAIVLGVRAGEARRAEVRRVWTDGTPGRARIIGIGSSRGHVNHHPNIDFELEVSVPGQAPYRVQLTALVSKLAVPRIQPEAHIDVRVDPNDRQRVVIDPALTPDGLA